jgi:GNAT superfamily N-acetyltransferase
MQIIEVDPHDEAALLAFWETEQRAVRHDRPDAVLRTLDALRTSTQTPGPFFRRTLLAAVEDGATVGVADLGRWLQANEHLAGLEISVLPRWRRRGVGSALHAEAERRRRDAGRTTVCGELYVGPGHELAASPAGAFASGLGYESVHREDHLVLALPVDDRHLRELRRASAGHAAAYDVVTWGNRCPDDHVEALCALHTQMSADVPSGGLDVETVVWDEDRLRTSEERTAASYDRVVAAARRREDGALVGYTLVYLPHGEDHALQDDTLVMPAHRGRRLGTLLKLATLEVISRDHPDRRALHTWTDPENLAMHLTNTRFGYQVVERMHEMQRKDA